MRHKLVHLAFVAACGGSSSNPQDSGIDGPPVDGPAITPTLTSFVASPNQVTGGVPTMVTWNWTYAIEPTFPDPSCTIDNGVGPVMRGQATPITITQVTTFTLTCTNPAGMAQRQVIVGIPPAAPQLATFTITPANIAVNTATTVTFNFTFANVPSPPATCAVEHGVGNVTNGSTAMVTQPGTRVYRLRCTNTAGSATREASVAVDECASAAANDCGPNSTCNNTADGFTCTCNAGYTLVGDQCQKLENCFTTPALCGANATCQNTVAGPACVCAAGSFGPGDAAGGGCTRARRAFLSTVGPSGNLATWADAGGNVGLAAADSVCQAQANAAGMTAGNGFGPFRAWMSDSTSDAYCRAHNLGGKKSAMCGQGALPVAAGPWVRVDGQPWAPRIDRLLAPTRQMFHPVTSTATGGSVSTVATVLTGTDDSGVLVAAQTCNDWTSSSVGVTGVRGEVGGTGGGAWTNALATPHTCNGTGHLRCIEVVDATTQGVPLPAKRPPAGVRRLFVTSTTGNGLLSSWPDANGASGITAADEVCRARARFAGYPTWAAFEAYLSTSATSASTRITNAGSTWVRPDGYTVATSSVDLRDSLINASVSLTETGVYLPGTSDTGGVWTGSTPSGSTTGLHCSSWLTNSAASSGTSGRHDLIDGRWTQQGLPSSTAICSTVQRIYCYED